MNKAHSLGYSVPGQGVRWLEATVAEVVDECQDVRRISFDFPHVIPAHDPGAHVKVQIDVSGKLAMRSYSVVSIKDRRRVTIAVRRMENGFGGSKAMHLLAPGDRIRASEPTNHFRFLPGAEFYQLIAGGIGITPIIGMARALKAMRKPFSILFLGRDETTMPLLADLRREFPQELKLHADSVNGIFDFGPLIVSLPNGAEIYMCGPVPMMNAVKTAWAAAGRVPDLLRFETFGAASDKLPEPFLVRIPSRGLEVEVAEDQTFLEALEQAGAEPLYFCQRGECGLCIVDVVEHDGQLDHRDVFFSPEERAHAEQICTCVSRATGVMTIEMP